MHEAGHVVVVPIQHRAAYAHTIFRESLQNPLCLAVLNLLDANHQQHARQLSGQRQGTVEPVGRGQIDGRVDGVFLGFDV